MAEAREVRKSDVDFERVNLLMGVIHALAGEPAYGALNKAARNELEDMEFNERLEQQAQNEAERQAEVERQALLAEKRASQQDEGPIERPRSDKPTGKINPTIKPSVPDTRRV